MCSLIVRVFISASELCFYTYNCQMLDLFFSCMAGFSLDALQEINSKFTESVTTKKGKGMEQCVTLIFLKSTTS